MNITANWQFVDTTRLVVVRALPDGATESALASREDVAEWLTAHPNTGVVTHGDPPTLAMLKADLLAAATSRRWAVEAGGIELPGGIRVATGKDDQDRITSVLVNAQAAGVASVDFKAKTGWVTLSIDDVRGIATAIALHVQACFSAERAHHEAIAALPSIDAAQAYDISTGWPVVGTEGVAS